MINNVVLVSGIQKSDSVIHIQVSILFQILFPFRLLQNIEQSSLCYTVGPYWLSILNIALCAWYLGLTCTQLFIFSKNYPITVFQKEVQLYNSTFKSTLNTPVSRSHFLITCSWNFMKTWIYLGTHNNDKIKSVCLYF